MSPIGRIFLVLNLILSAVFLGWASNSLAQTEDFRGQLDEAKQMASDREAELTSEIEDLNTRLRDKEQEASQFREERDSRQDTVNSLETQLAAAKSEKEKLLGDVTAIQATLGDYQGTIDRLSSEKDQANQRREEAEASQRDAVGAQEAAQQAERDAIAAQQELERQIADLEVAQTELTTQVEKLDTHLAVIQEQTGVAIDDILAPKKVDGAVLAVDASTGLVMLNVGAEDGVKRGYSFDVWSGNQYKGQVQVMNVQPGMCSALIKSPVEGATIGQGDLASTRML
jgi:predicted  nucleic acid-binding Zn-ribbon protein